MTLGLIVVAALDELGQHAQLMAAVVTEDGELLLLLPQGIGIVMNLAELLLHLHAALLREEYAAYLVEAAAHGDDEAYPDDDENEPAYQHVEMDSRQVLDLLDQLGIAHTPLIIGEEQRHEAEILPEGGRLMRVQELLARKESAEQPHHPREADHHQAEIEEEVRAGKVSCLHPDLFQEQDGHRVDEDRVDALYPEHEEVAEPEGPYREHQQQEVRPVADEVELLEGASPHLDAARQEERCDEQELDHKDDEMADNQGVLFTRCCDDAERIVAQISHRQQRDAKQEYRDENIIQAHSSLSRILLGITPEHHPCSTPLPSKCGTNFVSAVRPCCT